jgi:hypothetical protein
LDRLHDEPARLAANDNLTSIPIQTFLEMARLHDVIGIFAMDFATDAWTLLGEHDCRDRGQDDPASSTTEQLTLSHAEHFRFCRAFYEVELYLRLARGDETTCIDGLFKESRNEWFFMKYPPWRNEQLSCAPDFLEKRLREGMHKMS